MRRILMALIVAAVLVAGCGGDDDDAGSDGSDGTATESNTAADSAGEPTGADGQDLPEPISSDPDGDAADFPIPSPTGAIDAAVGDADGQAVAQLVYAADRYDEIVDHYEGWFLDNGLIATAPDRSLGIVSLGGQNESGGYLATIITDGDQLVVQLVAE